MFLIALYHVKSSFPDLTVFAVAILDFSTAILKIGQFRLAMINIQLTHAHEHFYQVPCSYLHVPSFCHFRLCLTYELGSHLEISVSHLENVKNCDD